MKYFIDTEFIESGPLNPIQLISIGVVAEDGREFYWHNYNPGQGMATIVCYGCAWNCYFGAMGEDSIQKFFARADVDYLTTKLVYTQFLKNTVQHKKYVTRIVTAIKEFLAKEPQ